MLRHYEIRSVRDHPVEGRICYLRHDVDWSIDGAVQMAQIEAEHDVKSTYYLMPTLDYMRRATQPIKIIRKLGHEIGYHHNLLVTYFRKREQIELETLFRSGLAKLECFGVTVETTCAHGDPRCRKGGYSNYEAFEECPPQLRKIGKLPRLISLEDHGLRAVEFLPHDCYIWDSGGGWQYTYNPYVDDFHGESQEWGDLTDRTLRNLGTIDAEQIILLTHPIWWYFMEYKRNADKPNQQR